MSQHHAGYEFAGGYTLTVKRYPGSTHPLIITTSPKAGTGIRLALTPEQTKHLTQFLTNTESNESVTEKLSAINLAD
jgi:hypothetical protein